MEKNNMLPQYSTVSFTDVWNLVDLFIDDFDNSAFKDAISDESKRILFYLLYARYGNNPIANRDIHQWKYKVFSIIYQYGPTWEKRLEIQKKLRELTDDELIKGAKSIFNHAYNPSTAPSTDSLNELNYINDQNTSSFKKTKMDAYAQLWNLLKVDVSELFLREFKRCFKTFVSPEQPLLYYNEGDVGCGSSI